MLEIEILRNTSQTSLGVLAPEGDFRGFWCPNDAMLYQALSTTLYHSNQNALVHCSISFLK